MHATPYAKNYCLLLSLRNYTIFRDKFMSFPSYLPNFIQIGPVISEPIEKKQSNQNN